MKLPVMTGRNDGLILDRVSHFDLLVIYYYLIYIRGGFWEKKPVIEGQDLAESVRWLLNSKTGQGESTVWEVF